MWLRKPCHSSTLQALVPEKHRSESYEKLPFSLQKDQYMVKQTFQFPSKPTVLLDPYTGQKTLWWESMFPPSKIRNHSLAHMFVWRRKLALCRLDTYWSLLEQNLAQKEWMCFEGALTMTHDRTLGYHQSPKRAKYNTNWSYGDSILSTFSTYVQSTNN
jgi:hypothetical protein